MNILEAIAYLTLPNEKADKGYTPERRLEIIQSICQEVLKQEYKNAQL